MGAVGAAAASGWGRAPVGASPTAGLADPVLVCSDCTLDMLHSGVARARTRRAVGWRRWLDATVRLPDAGVVGTAALLALLLGLSRWPILDLVALAALGLIFFIRPDVCAAAHRILHPFWPRPKALAGLEFGLYELLLWLASRWSQWHAGWCRGLPKLRRVDCASGSVSTGRFSRFSPLALRRHWRPIDRMWPCSEFHTVFLTGALFYALITRGGRSFEPSLQRPLVVGLLWADARRPGRTLAVRHRAGRVDVEGVGRVPLSTARRRSGPGARSRRAARSWSLAAFGALS